MRMTVTDNCESPGLVYVQFLDVLIVIKYYVADNKKYFAMDNRLSYISGFCSISLSSCR
jgi:hypothetical protein